MLSFEKGPSEKWENHILIPPHVVYALVKILALLSALFAGMQATSVVSRGSFECLPAVNCPSRFNLSSVSRIQNHDVCKDFYNSQETIIVNRRDSRVVVADLSSSLQYFVNSQCRKSAIPNFLSYFGIILAIQTGILFHFARLRVFKRYFLHFFPVAFECYASPYPNFLSTAPRLDLVDYTATVSAVRTMFEKVKTLRKKFEEDYNLRKQAKRKTYGIYAQYRIQSVCLIITAFISFAIDIYYRKDLKEDTIVCSVTQNIPIPHDYFICTHRQAPIFAVGLYIYITVLGILNVWMFFETLWIFRLGRSNCKFDFKKHLRLRTSLRATYSLIEPQLSDIESQLSDIEPQLSDIEPIHGDLGFLLHLLRWAKVLYVIRFAWFLSQDNEKNMQAYLFNKKCNKLFFTKLQGIPVTTFALRTKIVTLELTECGLEKDDFNNVCQLISLKKLLIIKCNLKSIPANIFEMKWLEEMDLNNNDIRSINQGISNMECLKSLDLSNNDLKTIEPESLDCLDNLVEVYLSGNPRLDVSGMKVVLACERLAILVAPQHLSDRVNELNELEKTKFHFVML